MTSPTRRHWPSVESLEDRHLLSTVFALTPSNGLFAFDTTNPAALTAPTPISGLPRGETLQAIDFRPATGQPLALGSANGGRLYALDPATAAATAIGPPFAVPLTGTAFGFDVDPVADVVRVTGNDGQNLRLNPDTALVLRGPSDPTPAHPPGHPRLAHP